MKYYKTIINGYIQFISTCNGETEITENEYNEIMDAIKDKPQETEMVDYLLKTDLTWESYEKESVPETNLDANEALEIILGVAEL